MRAIDALHAAGQLAKPFIGCVVALAATAGWAIAAEPPVLVLSPDGDEVINAKAGIAWSRCVEGMRWSGKKCVGTALYLDHAQATKAAALRRQADGKSWRLPRVPELKRMAGRWAAAQHQEPTLFPGTPEDWHWSSTTTVDTSRVNPYEYGNIRKGVTNENMARISFRHGWAVHAATGEADGNMSKRTRLAVRLVRSLDP